ncbi:MAG: phosphodiester glycosidase family protein [Anaerolineae bacterium]
MLVIVLLVLAACGRSPQQPIVTIVASPGPTAIPLPSRPPTPTPMPIGAPTPSTTPTAWETVAEGVQIRRMIGFEGGRGGDVFALRLDPARVDMQLRYDPDRPRRIAGWFADERPLAALNAGFFDRDNTPIGLWVIEGIEYGRGYHRIQGEFRVSGAGVSIRRVSERHLTDGTRTIASIESYPFLLLPGGSANPCLYETVDEQIERIFRPCANLTEPAERLVVGIDGAGFVLFVLIPSATFTFPGLADWLDRSDLNLSVALNLDGGSSAGMLVQAGGAVWGQDSGREVPGALIVLPKVFGVDGGGSR